jgi:hypothetical protein
MPDAPNDNPNQDNDDFEVDIFSRLREMPKKPQPNFQPTADAEEDEPEEDFWATFSMITHTGERFAINVCFSSRKHYNAEMHKFETAKNAHVAIRDVNDETVLIKRDILLYVLPYGNEERLDK